MYQRGIFTFTLFPFSPFPPNFAWRLWPDLPIRRSHEDVKNTRGWNGTPFEKKTKVHVLSGPYVNWRQFDTSLAATMVRWCEGE
jgi:hypothetical protein